MLRQPDENRAMETDRDHQHAAQSSTAVFPNRKRRFRNSQEYISASASTSNGLLKKKSDLSCVERETSQPIDGLDFLVCSDLAHGYNFDAISCESCKAFFRRNALFTMERLKCRHDGQCEITAETRRRCKACRLKKCFSVGMRKEWILTEEEKVNKKRRIEENRKLRVTTTGDDEDNPSLNKRDAELQNVLSNKNDRPLKAGENNDLLSNVVTAFADGFKLDPSSYGWSYPLARKITALCQILHTKNTTALRLISSYKRLPEFDTLDEMDKMNLVKSNLRYLFFFQGCLGYDPVNDVYREGNSINDHPVLGADIREVYGEDIHVRCTLIIRALHGIGQLDRRIIQLALVIFLFSKGLSNLVNMQEPSLNNGEQVWTIQNLYVEQLWFLLERTHGSARAVLIFASLIEKCLLIQNLLRDIQQDVHEKLSPDEVPPLMRSVMHLS